MKNLFALIIVCLCVSCTKYPELTLEEIARITNQEDSIIKDTLNKPYKGEDYVDGSVGGTWNDSILQDPKTFNMLIAERDGSSKAITSLLTDYLVDYDVVQRTWKSRLASFKVEISGSKLIVHYTIKDNAFWSYIDSHKKIPVTSDDFVFWYNVIGGKEEFGSSSYGSQYVEMEDGTQEIIECKKIDDKNFDFIFPRIVADPLLHTNMEACPSFIYKEAYEKGGVDGVRNLFGVNCDLKDLPSCGMWLLTEYTPGQRLVFKRNDFHIVNSSGVSIPYAQKMVLQIVGDVNTQSLLFKTGKLETYSPRPEELKDMVMNQDSYKVYRSEGSLGSQLWSFNQNPKNKDKPYYNWFCSKKFRQAMSCILNRQRIIDQSYRGLADPKYDFFASTNPYYDETITLSYTYNPDRAISLLESIGITRDKDGIMRDLQGEAIEFDLSLASTNPISNDIGQIICDEARNIGIKINVRQIDFQKLVESLTSTYDWESIIIGLGTNSFPSQGSNVWPSRGNLHLWNPLQKTPSTSWETQVDKLYNKGCYTNDRKEAKKIWDEYQKIILEELPLIYLVRPKGFYALNNRWDNTNFYYDNQVGAVTEYLFLKE